MANLLWIAGVDVEATLGHGIIAMPNWRGAFTEARPFIGLPDAPAGLEGPATVEPRRLQLTLSIGNATITTAAQRAAAVSALVALVRSGRKLVTIRVGDRTDRSLSARYVSHRVESRGQYMEMTTSVPWAVTLEFVAPDPRWIATSATTLSSINATPRAVPAGDAEHDWIWTQTGGTDPVITVRDSDGNVVGTMSLEGNFTGETVTIRGGKTQSIATTLDLSGASPYSLLSDWDTEQWIRFLPDWWDGYGSDWMDVAVSSGSGQLVYSPAWRA